MTARVWRDRDELPRAGEASHISRIHCVRLADTLFAVPLSRRSGHFRRDGALYSFP